MRSLVERGPNFRTRGVTKVTKTTASHIPHNKSNSISYITRLANPSKGSDTQKYTEAEENWMEMIGKTFTSEIQTSQGLHFPQKFSDLVNQLERHKSEGKGVQG